MSEHTQLLSKARKAGFRTATNSKTLNSLLLVNGEAIIPDRRFDTRKLMIFASVDTTAFQAWNKTGFHHLINVQPLTQTEKKHTSVCQYLAQQNFRSFSSNNYFNSMRSKFNDKKAELDFVNDEVEKYVRQLDGASLTHMSKLELKQAVLPFMLSGFTPSQAEALTVPAFEVNSRVALAVYHEIISHEELADFEGLPHEWIEESVLPSDVDEQLKEIRLKVSPF